MKTQPMKVVAIIPARYASVRLQGKPLAIIGNKPMIQLVYEQAVKAKLLERVMVATDDQRILEVVEKFGGEAWLTSAHHLSGTDRITEVATKIAGDIIVNLQGDEPFIDPFMIDRAVKILLDNPEINLCTLKSRIVTSEALMSPHVVKVVTDNDDFALYFSRSPIPFCRQGDETALHNTAAYQHIGLYAYRRDFLLKFSRMKPTTLEKLEGLEQLRALENGCKIKVITCQYHFFGIDSPEDLERANQIVSRQKN